MSKRPTPATLTEYDRRPRAEDARISPFLREVHRELLDHIPLRAWDRVLSVECGDGWAAEEAWRRLGRGYVCGVDISHTMTDLAGRLRGVDGQLEFKPWDGERLPFPDQTFDFVLSTFAFYRYAEPRVVLRELRRVLVPGGDCFLLEPDRKSFGGLYSLWDYYFRLTDPGHVRYYATDEIVRLLVESGFSQTREVKRHETILAGGKLLGTAVVIHARREGEARSPKGR